MCTEKSARVSSLGSIQGTEMMINRGLSEISQKDEQINHI